MYLLYTMGYNLMLHYLSCLSDFFLFYGWKNSETVIAKRRLNKKYGVQILIV